MVDKGPILTSAIIFYLSIGAAIFQVLEEPNWEVAVENYKAKKQEILQRYTCLTKKDLEHILEVVSDAAGQGVTITGDRTFNNWNWPNAVIFAATVITTIGYGNISPKTAGGRVFCIFYGLSGVPLCLTWISEMGKFFGGRAKHLGRYLRKKGLTLRKTQLTCTAIFLLWGLLVHLLIPPLVFMSQENWTYIDGLYFSFVTLTTIGFGDLVAGVDPNADYPSLYRYFVEVWIFLGLAWLSLFFNWKVHMVVEAHKALKKRRKRRNLFLHDAYERTAPLPVTTNDSHIFSFMAKKRDSCRDLVKPRDVEAERKRKLPSRSQSCSDAILSLDHSPRLKRRFSFTDSVTVALSRSRNHINQDQVLLMREMQGEGEQDTDQEERSDGLEDQDLAFSSSVENPKECEDEAVESQTSDCDHFKPHFQDHSTDS